MPTGYTADVADGKLTDFRTFALRCARAMGACIMQRDDPMDEPPKMREESMFYAQEVERADARLAELDAMTEGDAERAAQAEYERQVQRNAEYDAEQTEKRNRYNAMLAEVMAWGPPSPEHVGFKDFMVEQLTESRKFDCGPLWDTPVKLSGRDWLAGEMERATRDVARSHKALTEERARVAGQNAWITALYDSLSGATV